MRLALRPYLIAGAAIAGAGIIVVAPAAPPLPDTQVPAVVPAGSELSGFNQDDLLGVLANTQGLLPAPDSEGLMPPGESPRLTTPAITPPDLGRLDLGGLDLSAVPSPSNPPSAP